jgi:hypothetical protein
METPVPDWLFGVKVRDDYAYVIGRTSGFRVVDVADPARMVEVSHDKAGKISACRTPGLEVIAAIMPTSPTPITVPCV